MSSTRETLAQRLREARTTLGLTQSQVAAELGVHRPTISEIEAARRGVSSEELHRFSQLYAVPLHVLLGSDGIEEKELEQVVFRTGRIDSPGARLATRRFLAWCRLERDLETLLGYESPAAVAPRFTLPLPENKGQAIRQGESLAESERRRLDLGVEPIRNPVELLDRQGVRVGPLEAGEEDTPDGLFFQSDELGACIGLRVDRSDPWGARRAFTTAHEYAHWILQDRLVESFNGLRQRSDDLLEVRANAFAAAFLMPETGLREYFRSLGLLVGHRLGGLSPAALVRAMDHFGVSRTALLYRLQNIGLLDAEQAAELRRAGIPFREIAEALGVEPRRPEPVGQRLQVLAKEAWKRGLIGTGRAAEIFGLGIEEFRKRMRLFGEAQLVDPDDPLLGAAR